MIEKEHNNTVNASNILRKGGKLLGEYCQKCEGLLFRYKERTICFNCDSINEIEHITNNSKTDLSIRIENIISKKIEIVLKNLENEEDTIGQMNLAELLCQYMNILMKIHKIKDNDVVNKILK